MVVKSIRRLLLIVPLLTGLPYGCEEPCGSFVPGINRITGFSTTVRSSSNRFLDHIIEGRLVTEQATLFKGRPHYAGFSAYACSPPPLMYTTDITSIKITSDANYSNKYPAGVNLIDLISIEPYGDKEFPLVIEAPILFFRLNAPPEENGSFSFTIHIDLDDGRSFTDTTPTISITQ